MNANPSTGMNDIRELSTGELEIVAGGNAVLAVIFGFALNRIFDKVADSGSVVDLEKMGKDAAKKKGKGWPF